MSDKPNIVLLVADQLNARHVGAYGNSRVHTPSIDALADRGARFATAYCQSPLCMPSRSSFNTGVYPHACGVLHNPVTLDERFPTIAEVLSDSGYATAGFGHLGGDGLERGFDTKVDLVDPPVRDAYLAEQRAVHARGSGHSAVFCGPHPLPEEQVQDSVATELAVDLLQSVTEPFYLQLSFMDPHIPLLVPQRFIDLYDGAEIELPPSRRDELADKPANVAGTRRATLAEKAGDAAMKAAIRHYHASVSYVDELVGRVVGALEDRGLLDDTIVVFTADHGDYAGEFGLVGKTGNFYDCLTKVPLIVAGPGVLPGTVIGDIVGLVDLAPTLYSLCGCRSPAVVQGADRSRSIAGEPMAHPAGRRSSRWAFAATRGHRGPLEDALATDQVWPEETLKPLPTDPYSSGPVSHVYDGVMVRSERYKLSVYGDGSRELYDLEADPWERNNLHASPAHQGIVTELLTGLLQWQIESWPTETPQSPLPYHYRATSADLIPEQFRDAHAAWREAAGVQDP